MKIRSLILFLILFLSFFAIAEAESPVNHSHDGRAHTHPLPVEGLGHSHNGGKMPTVVRNGWALIARTKDSTSEYWLKSGSYDLSSGNASIIAKMVTQPKEMIFVMKWSIPVEHCHAGMGRMDWHKVTGKYYGSKDFVLGCGSITCHAADVICYNVLN